MTTEITMHRAGKDKVSANLTGSFTSPAETHVILCFGYNGKTMYDLRMTNEGAEELVRRIAEETMALNMDAMQRLSLTPVERLQTMAAWIKGVAFRLETMASLQQTTAVVPPIVRE